MDRPVAITVETPLGRLAIVATPVGVMATCFDDGELEVELDGIERRLDAPIARHGRGLAHIRREIDAYFRGSRRPFRTPVDLSLTPQGFGRRVLEATMKIPFAELATYGDIAVAAGSPRGGRAAGNALNRCPMELYVPCHRVVHVGGTIGGYGRYEGRKRWLLSHEGAL
jgi:methylated-DNA-[protein]-cysteine S-methyltransferase